MKKNKVPIPLAIGFILASNLVVCGTAYHALKVFKNYREHKYGSPDFHVTSIIQSISQRDALSARMLSQMLGLSSDDPTNIFRVNVGDAVKSLLQFPMVKTAEVQPVKPSALCVYYALREPIAFIADFENTSVDEEGVLFPYSPFYSPKFLPEVYLGNEAFHEDDSYFGRALDLSKWKLAYHMIMTFKTLEDKHHIRLRKIDLSKMELVSLGLREIIIEITNDNVLHGQEPFCHYLRVRPNHLEQSLGNYLTLLSQMREEDTLLGLEKETNGQERIIDLRVGDVALIQNMNKTHL